MQNPEDNQGPESKPADDAKPNADDENVDGARLAFTSLLQIRDLENQLQWTRSNLILVVQAGLLTLLSLTLDDNRGVAIAICLAGGGVAWVWIRLTMGGTYWIAFWQQRLREVEPRALGENKVFRDHPNFEATSVVATHNQPRYVSTNKTLLIAARGSAVLWIILLTYVVVR